MTTESMPSYKPVEEILNFLQQTHLDAGNALHAINGGNHDEKLSLLMEVLEKQQRDLARFYADRSGIDQTILTTWIQYLPDKKIQDNLKAISGLNGDSPADAPEKIVELQDGVTDFLEALAQQTHAEEVREFLDSYLTRERSETSNTSRTVLGTQDV